MNKNLKSFTATKAKILILDNDIEILNEEKNLMNIYKMNTFTASTYEESLALLKKIKFDIIFIDPTMPGMNGIEAALKIRKIPGEYFKQVIIISISSDKTDHSSIKFIKNGFNDFLKKPLNSNVLNKILRTYLPREYIIYDKYTDDSNYNLKSINLENIDIENAIKNCGNNLKNYIQIINTAYLDGLKKLNTLINHINKNDWESYNIEILGIKTTAAIIGDMHLLEMVTIHENAMKKNDLSFIQNNAPMLISYYKKFLTNIKNLIPNTSYGHNVKITKKYNLIDISYLFDSLISSIDNFDLDYANEVIYNLLQYPLKNDYVSSLINISELLNIFDYEASYENAKLLKRYVLKNETL